MIGSENNYALVTKLTQVGTFERCTNEEFLRNTTTTTYTSTAFAWSNITTYNFLHIHFPPDVAAFDFEVDSLCFGGSCGDKNGERLDSRPMEMARMTYSA